MSNIHNIKILAINHLSRAGISIKKDIAELLKINVGDEILFILDENDHINIRKHSSLLLPKPKETYLSSAKISSTLNNKITVFITKDIANMLDLDEDRAILWILDENGNIIIRNTFLFPDCTNNIFNRVIHKDISAMIIEMTKIYYGLTSITRRIEDIIIQSVEDKILFITDEFDNIIVTTEKLFLSSDSKYSNYLILRSVRPIKFHIELGKKLLNMLNVKDGDSILWILDENGDLIIRDTILPKSCL